MPDTDRPIEPAYIQLTQGLRVRVDRDRLEALQKFTWLAHKAHNKWYAKTYIYVNGKRRVMYMHRFIAKTPKGMITHHLNSDSLDNREANLLNMTKNDHKFHHMHTQVQTKGRKIVICTPAKLY